MRGLYAIVDVSSLAARRLDPVAFTRAVVSARPCALQVRAKDMPTRELLALLRSVAPICRALAVPLVANDRVDLAALAGCDCVHLGQQDLPIELARRIAPGLRIGLSTHTPEQLEVALGGKDPSAPRPTYVAYGPVFPTGSKARPDPCVGVAGLRVAAARAAAARVPLVAIGGITLERARELAPFVSAVAVIAALLPPAGAEAEPESVVMAQVASRARQIQLAFAPRLASEALA